MLAKCVRRCFDNQTTKRYYIGMVDDLPEDHVFLTMKNPCFVPLTAKDLAKSQEDPNAKIEQLAAVVEKMKESIDSPKKFIEEPMKTTELIPEEKRPVGRPPKEK